MSTTPFTGSQDAALPPERPGEVSIDLDEELHLAKLRVEFGGEDPLPVEFRQWEVERRLGSGGMGVVYLARHLELGRRVALKILKPTGGDAALSSARFIREAQALARVQHDNVLQIHQVDTSGSRAVIELEYIDGLTLRAWQSQPGRGWRTIVAAYASVGDGLAALHQAELLHRDIKPDNLLMDGSDRVKIVDLGLAVAIRRAKDAAADRSAAVEYSALDLQLTADGAIVGTHGYMAPEVIVGAEVSAASDQFSLAVSLYEAAYGVRPFTASSPSALAEAIRSGTLTRAPDQRRRPAWLARVLGRALSFEPERRYPCVADFVRALRRGLGRRRWLGWGSVAALIVVGLPLTGWMVKPAPLDPCADAGAEMDELWNADLRGELEGRASAASSPQVDRSFALLIATLDSRTRAWTESRALLCVAAIRQPELDAHLRQRACLEQVRRSMGALVAELRVAKQDLARHYMDTAAALEGLPLCDARQGSAQSPAFVADVEADATLAAALGAEAAGRYLEAADLARQVVEDTRGRDRWRHAEALYRLGHILGTERRGALALATLDAAQQAALAIHHDELFCRTIVFQAKLSALVDRDADRAARDLGLAWSCVDRVGAQSPTLLADLIEAGGLHAEASGAVDDAIARQREALELRRSYFGDEHPDTAKSLLNLANALAEAEGPRLTQEARERYAEALKLRTSLFGEAHPEVADVLFDLGNFLRLRGEVERAREHLQGALDIYADAPGAHHPIRAQIHMALAAMDIEGDELTTAGEQLERAYLLQTADPRDAPRAIDVARRLHLTGRLALSRAELGPAADALRRATALYRQIDRNSAAAWDCLVNEIEANYGLGDFTRIAALVRDEGEALADYLRALEARERGPLAWYIGEALLEQSATADALTYLRVALAAYEGLGNLTHVAELRAQLKNHQR